jgi:hypothetical protein
MICLFHSAVLKTTRFNYASKKMPGLRSRYGDSVPVGRSGDRIPVGAIFSAPVQTGPGTHPASYTRDTVNFSGVKRSGRGVEHPSLSGTDDKERVQLYLFSPSEP